MIVHAVDRAQARWLQTTCRRPSVEQVLIVLIDQTAWTTLLAPLQSRPLLMTALVRIGCVEIACSAAKTLTLTHFSAYINQLMIYLKLFRV